MNPQLERLFHSVRRGIETNVKTALKTMEVTRQQDYSLLRKRIDHLAKNELVLLRKKLDEVKTSLNRVEAFKPYISAIEAATRSSRKKKTRRVVKTKARKSVRKKTKK